MVRKPFVAGQFYESDFDKIEKQLKKCFESKLGPGDLPITKREKKIKAVVAPHAGYQFSGPCAAWVYKEIGETPIPDVYIIIGPSHNGVRTSTTFDDFETPFGIVKTDKNFVETLVKNGIPSDQHAHETEHSIEVQLPFLQFVNKDYLNSIRIVPIIIGDSNYERVAFSLSRTIKELNKKVIIIASSDFTHYGYSYGYVPFIYNIKEEIHNLDHKAIDLINKMDVTSFINFVEKTKATICGRYAIASMLKTLNSGRGKLLSYYTSGDITGDYSNSVSYAGIVIE